MTNEAIKRATEIGTAFDSTKLKAKKHATSWKAGCLAVLIGLCLFAYLGFKGFMIISNWYDSHQVRFQSPIITRPPVIIEKRAVIKEITVKTIDSSLEDKKLAKINDLYRKVRFIESTAGMNSKDPTATHNYCSSIGQVNNIGYLVDGNRQFCFKDFADEFNTFKTWWMKRLDNNLANADSLLCVWNTGTSQPMCNYSMKIATLN